MHSIQQLLGMVATEAGTPPTHECRRCGHVFSPESDSCPSCGKGDQVEPIDELQPKDSTGPEHAG